MSNQPNPKDYYANTAYKPAKRVAWEEANPDRQGISGSRLTWYRRTQDNGTKDEYGHNNLAISKNWEARRAKLRAEDSVFHAIKVRYDHQSIMPPHYSFLSKCMHILMGFGIVFLWMSLICFFNILNILELFYFW